MQCAGDHHARYVHQHQRQSGVGEDLVCFVPETLAAHLGVAAVVTQCFAAHQRCGRGDGPAAFFGREIRHAASGRSGQRREEQEDHQPACRVVSEVVLRLPREQALQVGAHISERIDKIPEASVFGADETPEDAEGDHDQYAITRGGVQPCRLALGEVRGEEESCEHPVPEAYDDVPDANGLAHEAARRFLREGGYDSRRARVITWQEPPVPHCARS